MRLTLLVPELLWPEPGDTLTLGNLPTPGFAWLDGHANFLRSTPLSQENALLALAGQPAGSAAYFRQLGEAAVPELGSLSNSLPSNDDGRWLCADPVHLRFHHERSVPPDAGPCEIPDPEPAALIAAPNTTFPDIGVFHAATPRRWYLHLNTAVDHLAEPISAVAGRRMDSELADKTSPLHRWLNEVQMFLHLHPINEQRAAEGKPAINSLWLWGAAAPLGKDAALPSAESPDAIFSRDPLALGLALGQNQAGRSCRALPLPASPSASASLDALLSSEAKQALVVLDTLLPTVLYENPEGWRQAWAALEADWFVPCCGQLGKKIKNLDIVAPTIYGCLQWSVSSGERWKFWKKGRPLAEIANALAATAPEGKSS